MRCVGGRMVEEEKTLVEKNWWRGIYSNSESVGGK